MMVCPVTVKQAGGSAALMREYMDTVEDFDR